MRDIFSFFFMMIFGFIVFVPWLIFVVPMIGMKTFLILLVVVMVGFVVEGWIKMNKFR
ncbi:hypothetical protein [Gracilibacillus halophilus]|uniref:hypothetical protein n=1 Tax=Gracilibacillus halophilus TaxID=470864 RepID=UPI00039C3740|nr:hypothetical protein [Gracilibacillus halophilus]